MQLIGTGVFPDQKYMRVAWIGIKNGEQIGKIANKIEEQVSKLGFEKENREFSVHLTIGRVKSAKNKEKLLQVIEKYKDTNFGNYNVDSIKLKKSELTPKGPIYTTLKEVKL
jgi:2'-5' RNA ligase